ncbi:CBS domain-containing protein [Haloferax sp. Atlit-6N]|uniref:CBS domain-containing protein n=1 Tax=Haloferax sp. Atlit-6N TaxID=2077205 RepID=UPI0021042A48|nr:CBS domain-containing protein [Haloferax sp. Atlit-6N]
MRQLRNKRRRLQLQQKSVAHQAGISKSTLNRMERTFSNANYSTVYKVWRVVTDAERENSETAEDLMTGNVAYAQTSDSHRDTALYMRENAFSQMPVKDEDGLIVGSISERELADNSNHDRQIGEIMDEPFIQINKGTSENAVRGLLFDGVGALLVKDSEDVIGIITTADLI